MSPPYERKMLAETKSLMKYFLKSSS